jgi:hypothetical protein
MRRFSSTYDTPDGRPEVVLEHAEGALAVADQVDAGDVDAHAADGAMPRSDREVVLRAEDQLARERARRQDALRAVDVVEEQAERAHALLEAALELVPVAAGDDARQHAEREDLLGAALSE